MGTIVVTGGAGFIGSNLIDRLLLDGHKVVAVDDLSGGYLSNLPDNPNLEFEQIDCRDFKEIDHLMCRYKPEIVYHLSANAAENKAQFSPVDITSRGYQAGVNVLTASIRNGVKKFIFTSSIAVYGNSQLPYKETNRPEPEDLYGIGKLAMEETVKVMAKVHGIEYMILRPHNVYGPKQNMSDPFRNVVTIFMNSILNDKPYVLYGNGNMVRCFTYIDDVVEALVRSLGLSNLTVNVGSSTPSTIRELSDLIQKVSGINLPPQLLPARPQEVLVAISDHSLSDKVFGIRETSLRKGIIKTWDWIQRYGPVEAKFTDIEINNNLPSNWK